MEIATEALAQTPTPVTLITTSSLEIRDSIQDLDVTNTPDFVTINVCEDTPDEPVASSTQHIDFSVSHESVLNLATPTPRIPVIS